jgi:hypothetical protein
MFYYVIICKLKKKLYFYYIIICWLKKKKLYVVLCYNLFNLLIKKSIK